MNGDNIIPWRPRRDTECVIEPNPEELAHLKEQAQGFFQAALRSAWEATFDEALRGLPNMGSETLRRVVSEVVKQESARYRG